MPIICICNDKYNQKLKSLRNHCLELDYRRGPAFPKPNHKAIAWSWTVGAALPPVPSCCFVTMRLEHGISSEPVYLRCLPHAYGTAGGCCSSQLLLQLAA